MIVHVYPNDLQPLMPRAERIRNCVAQGTWYAPESRLFPFTPSRGALDVGNDRNTPYINDILDFGCDEADRWSDVDGVLWCNMDLCFVRGAMRTITERLAKVDCCFGHRVDVDDAMIVRTEADLLFQTQCEGVDWFAFKPAVWRQMRHRIPPMFIASEAFDVILRHEMTWHTPDARMAVPLSYHQHNPSRWRIERFTNPANLHNRRQARAWCKATGFPPYAEWQLQPGEPAEETDRSALNR